MTPLLPVTVPNTSVSTSSAGPPCEVTVALFSGEIARRGRGGLWRVLRPVIGCKRQRCGVTGMTPDVLNDFYAAIGPETANSVPTAAVQVPTFLPRVHTCSFRVTPIDFNSLCITIATMRTSKSTGLDGISIDMLQKFFFGLGSPLLDMLTQVLPAVTSPGSGNMH